MKGRVAITFNFEAAHWDPMWPKEHPNHRMHGHSYLVELIAEGPVRDDMGGVLVSIERLKAIADTFKPMLDHRVLNEVEGLAYPTMEHIAHWLLTRVRLTCLDIKRVRVSRPSLGVWAEAG